MFLKRILLLLVFLCPLSASAQIVSGTGGFNGGTIGSNSSPVTSSTGQPLAGVNIAICQPMLTSTASVSNNLATLVMTGNPQASGYVTGKTLVVTGFTGGDTAFNGSFTIASVSASAITYGLTAPNATASTVGSALQQGDSTTPCAALAPIFADPALTMPLGQPIASDGLGNWNAWAVPAVYQVQFYGPSTPTILKQYAISCVPASPLGPCNTTSNAATANALATTPSGCFQPTFATGIQATGNANCDTPSNVTGNAATASALANTPSQCGSNIPATGVNAAGNAICGSKTTTVNGTLCNLGASCAIGTLTTPTITLKKGTGSGNYTNPATSATDVDVTNLAYTATIPLGWKLAVTASGAVTVSTAAVFVSAYLFDSQPNTQILQVSATPTAAGQLIPFTLTQLIAGDGNSHTIKLQYATSNGSDSVVVQNSGAAVPTMLFTLTPSN